MSSRLRPQTPRWLSAATLGFMFLGCSAEGDSILSDSAGAGGAGAQTAGGTGATSWSGGAGSSGAGGVATMAGAGTGGTLGGAGGVSGGSGGSAGFNTGNVGNTATGGTSGSAGSNTGNVGNVATGGAAGGGDTNGGSGGSGGVNTGNVPNVAGGGAGGTEVSSGTCTFSVDYEISAEISTVGIVNWSTDLPGVDGAYIEFAPSDGGTTLQAPIDSPEAQNRTLLLGMKGATDYDFHIVASAGGQTCQSETYPITTGDIPTNVPTIGLETPGGSPTPGFIVTTAGLGGGIGVGGGGPMFIFDQDGDVVWYADAPGSASRARMTWEGDRMYMMTLNYPQTGGEVRWVSMDGLQNGTVAELRDAHHDFTVKPGGIITAVVYSGGCDAIVEYSPDGGVETIVANTNSLYTPGNGLIGGTECHGNAITYQEADDTYILSDRNPSLFVRFTSAGELLWQLGGGNPKDPSKHLPGSWSVNHGHHWMEDGSFLFFNNESGNASPVHQYQINEAGMSSSLDWTYNGGPGSATLGDVQMLDNGHVLITYSNRGTIHEIDSERNLVAEYTTGSLGYVMHRTSLYGAPPK